MSSERQKARGGSQEGKDSRKHVRVYINMLWLDMRLTLHSTALLEKLTIVQLGNKFHTHTHTHIRGVIKKTMVNAAAECVPTERQGSSIREAVRRTLVTVCDKF